MLPPPPQDQLREAGAQLSSAAGMAGDLARALGAAAGALEGDPSRLVYAVAQNAGGEGAGASAWFVKCWPRIAHREASSCSRNGRP
jgi:hypothetical protein